MRQASALEAHSILACGNAAEIRVLSNISRPERVQDFPVSLFSNTIRRNFELSKIRFSFIRKAGKGRFR
jgi:hypothetical protein